jgi:hypothetical protein
VSSFVSLKADSGGRPHMSYYDATNKDLKYAYMDSSHAWHAAPVDSAGDVGKYSSLVLDSGNWPHIAYYDETNGALKYTFQDATGWHTMTLDDPASGSAGFGLSLAATPNGYGVAYVISDSTNTLKYKSCAYLLGNCAWYLSTSETVSTYVVATDQHGEIAGVSLAVDAAGKPYISYETSVQRLAVASKTGSAWSSEIVDIGSFSNGMHSSLALDRYGKLHVSYIDTWYGSLMFAAQLTKTYLPAVLK